MSKRRLPLKLALGENPKSVYHDKSQTPVTRMATAALIREQLHKAKHYLEDKKRALEDEDSTPPEYDLKCEALIPALEKEIQVHFHAHRADDIFTAIRLAEEFGLDYVIVHGTEGHLIADELKEEQVRILSGPFLSDRSKPEFEKSGGPGALPRGFILSYQCCEPVCASPERTKRFHLPPSPKLSPAIQRKIRDTKALFPSRQKCSP